MISCKPIKVRNLARWILFAIITVAVGMSTSWNGYAQTMDQIVAGAKKEGEVRVSISVRKKRRGLIMGTRLIEAFQKKYPFINVKYKRIGGSRQRERVFSELVGGMISYDVATLSNTQVEPGIKANIFQKVNWKKLGARPTIVHPTGVGVSYRTQVFGMGYNTDLVSKEDAQKLSWEDCINPKWAGKFATDDRPRHLEVLYQDNAWGREKTLDYARKLAANKPIIVMSRSEAVLKLSAGAHHIICGARWSGIRRQIAWGSKNIGFTAADPAIITAGDLIFVPRTTKNPNAGLLWILWSVSDEGQRLLDEVQWTGNPAISGTSAEKLIKGKKTVEASWEYQSRSNDILKEILTAMGFPVVR